MTEAIAQDPMFQEMAKEMQESMLAGDMGGLNLGEREGQESEDAGAAEPAAGSEGPAPGMPAIDPTKYMEAMQRVMQNPEFMAAAESLGRGLLSQSMSPDDLAMLEIFQNPANQEALKTRLEGLKEDPELAEVMKDIEENGQGALMKYMNDPEIMSKVGRKFQEAMNDPEFRAQLRGTETIQGGEEDEDEDDEEEELEETIINLASAGLVDRLKELLAEDGADADERDEEGRTALHFAAGYSELEAMRVLLDAGADVNAKDQNSNTALHYAAGYGNQDAAKVLLDRGADLKVTNAEGKTAGEVAEMNEHNDLAKMLETPAE